MTPRLGESDTHQSNQPLTDSDLRKDHPTSRVDTGCAHPCLEADGLSAAKGILNALALAIPFWLLIFYAPIVAALIVFTFMAGVVLSVIGESK